MTDWIDHPLDQESQDELARGPFAALVAAALLQDNKHRSTVVGVCGSWGTGKSSVANFVNERLRIQRPKAKVVWFEPWMVSTTEALVREFFSELGRAILPSEDTPEAKQKRAQFYNYAARALHALAVGSESLQLAVPGAGLAAKALTSGREALKIAATGLEEQAAEPSLRDARRKLSESLAGIDDPVIVVIDDIDRLDTDEIRTLFKLIKACADFPNVRYLLLYDKDQVIHALGGSVHRSDFYLEKIIGQAYDLPMATKVQRRNLVSRHLEQLGIHELDGKPLERLQRLFDAVLLPGLKTVRQVKRFTATVRSLLPGVIVEGYRNVDPADFLALEFIRQFAPELYEAIRDEDEPIPGGTVAEMSRRDQIEQNREMARSAAMPTEDPLRTLAQEALDILADDVENFASIGRVWVLRQHVERRFASEHWRPVYFGFHSGRAAFSDQDWRALREALDACAPADDLLRRLDNPEQRTLVARAIADRVDDISEDDARKLLRVILLWGEQQASEPRDPFANLIDPMQAVWLIGTSCLIRLTKAGNGLEELESALADTHALVGAAYIAGMELEQMKHYGSHGDWALHEQIAPFAKDLAARLRAMLDNGQAWQHPSPDELQLTYNWLADKDEYSTWWDQLTSNPGALAEYVNHVMAVHRRQRGFTGWGGSPDEPFYKAIEALDEAQLSADGKWARALYLTSVKRNAGGREETPRAS